ncbi:P-loop containing nucleoside triphosphate hydrolase protein [Mycena latifolia]|nr:P-loop containing nucleoside triphosphate hydrolase protein [Mycena latifolia]
MNCQSTLHQRMEVVTDLATLSSLSDDAIVACLRGRFISDTIYNNIGSSSLVALNPLPPHIFQLANNAYYHMKRMTQDQSIIFTGETASGPVFEFVLEPFGNACTLFNPNASRFGQVHQTASSATRGRLQGIKTLNYYLERTRISGTPNSERNLHIFYSLVAGATPEERQHLHLLDKTTYHYLGQHRAATASNARPSDDAVRFEQLKVALKTIGLSKHHVAQMCQLVAAILHLGNLEFTIDCHRNEDTAVVRNTDVCEVVADLLDVQPGDLEQTLSYKTKLVKKELRTVFLNPDGASDNHDDQDTYSLLFVWLNKHINQWLCKDDLSTFIGLFDLPGPQNLSRPNSLDQFCINFANECLQSWTQQHIFEAHIAEYTTEGIIPCLVPVGIPYFDNAECIQLLQNKPGGGQPGAPRAQEDGPHMMVQAFTKRWGNHSSFKMGGGLEHAGFPTFTIGHLNGPVTNSTEGFLARNQDALKPDFVSLLRSSGEGGLVNPFVQGRAIATQVHPRNEDMIVAVQQPVKPMRALSARRKGTIRRAGSEGSAGTAVVVGAFRTVLDTLFATVDETQTWHVFCINPNDAQLPNQLERRSVKGQVFSAGLTQVTHHGTCVFEVRMTPAEFCEWYAEGLEAGGVSEGQERERVH